ncbi:Shikimate O-hydroxycinnamoyltransferase [Nymphaea thermarum]|nr:Shikimate O-hydroxycinnamoyltransferase [Nymphaea thermarum]
MQEFLDLQQNHLSLEEYVTKYRHLEAYCPHLYTTAEARADKFIYGLRDGLRGRVMSSSPRNLDEVVTRARRMEEDWARTQRDHQKKTSQHTQGGRMPVKHHHPAGRARPYERRDDRTFRRNRPGRSETTQGSMASPTSPRCPTCSRAHPGKPCYRMTGACLHCGGMGHFIKDCPLKKERDLKKPEAGPSSVRQTAGRRVPSKGRQWTSGGVAKGRRWPSGGVETAAVADWLGMDCGDSGGSRWHTVVFVSPCPCLPQSMENANRGRKAQLAKSLDLTGRRAGPGYRSDNQARPVKISSWASRTQIGLLLIVGILSSDVMAMPTYYAASKIHNAISRMDDRYLRWALNYLELQPDLRKLVRGTHMFECPKLSVTSCPFMMRTLGREAHFP